MTTAITNKQLDALLRHIERDNLNRNGRSLSFGSMSNHCRNVIVETRSHEGILIVVDDWRALLRERFTEEK